MGDLAGQAVFRWERATFSGISFPSPAVEMGLKPLPRSELLGEQHSPR